MKKLRNLIDRHPSIFRAVVIAFLAPVLLLVVRHGYNLLNVGNAENVFETTRSRLYVTRDIQADLYKTTRRFFDFRTHDSRFIRKGDLVTAIEGGAVESLADVEERLSRNPANRIVTVQVQRPSEKDFLLSYRVPRFFLQERFLWEIPHTVYVWDVAKGGASHRAGMRAGDLIHEINGNTFKNEREADALVRNLLQGQTVTFSIIRKGQFLSLQVTMARLTIPVPLILFEIAGFLWVIFGMFMLLYRPKIKAARLLGWGFFLVGASFLLYENRGGHHSELFPDSLRLCGYAGLFIGIAVLLHAAYYFPMENRFLLKRQFLRYQTYLMAVLATAWTAVTGPTGLTVGFTALFLPQILIRLRNRDRKGKQQLALEKHLIFGVTFGIAVVVFWSLVHENLSLALDLLIRAPAATVVLAAYVFTIFRHRLLGIRMRRDLQYSAISAIWLLVLLFGFAYGLGRLSRTELNWNITLTTSSIEVHDRAIAPRQQEYNRSLLLMVAAILLGYLLFQVNKMGSRFLKTKFHRHSYDYLGATGKLAEVFAARLTLAELARGMVENIARTMLLKKVGLVIFRADASAVCAEGFGFEQAPWQRFCAEASHRLASEVRPYRAEQRIDYLSGEVKERLAEEGFKYVYPIFSHQRLLGCLLVGEKLSETAHGPDDFRFLAATVNQGAFAIENAFLYEQLAHQERLKHELALARHIQISSLPQAEPQVTGLDVSGTSIPAQEVGGDYYAYFQEDRTDVTIVVGDVSGKGTSAALYMSKMQGIFSVLYSRHCGPRDIFVQANPILYNAMEKTSFVTAICARFDTCKKQLTLARAGHLPLFVLRAEEGIVYKFQPGGMGLGLVDSGLFSTVLEEMSPGLQAR